MFQDIMKFFNLPVLEPLPPVLATLTKVDGLVLYARVEVIAGACLSAPFENKARDYRRLSPAHNFLRSTSLAIRASTSILGSMARFIGRAVLGAGTALLAGVSAAVAVSWLHPQPPKP